LHPASPIPISDIIVSTPSTLRNSCLLLHLLWTNQVCCSGTPQVVAKNDEYKELFGDRASTILSLYEHKHDHTHSPDGTIKRKQ